MEKQIYAVLRIDFDNGVTYIGKPILTDPRMKSYEKRLDARKVTFTVFETKEKADAFYKESREKVES